MNSGKGHLALELLGTQAEGIHAKISKTLEEDGARDAGEMCCRTGGEAVEFVELDCGGKEQLWAGGVCGSAEREQGVVGNVEKNMAHGLSEQGIVGVAGVVVPSLAQAARGFSEPRGMLGIFVRRLEGNPDVSVFGQCDGLQRAQQTVLVDGFDGGDHAGSVGVHEVWARANQGETPPLALRASHPPRRAT